MSLEEAKLAGNTWNFEDRDWEMYVARGEESAATLILDTQENPVAEFIHTWNWKEKGIDPFVYRENNSSTKLQRLGRSTKQQIDSANDRKFNAELYKQLIVSGAIKTPDGNGGFNTDEKSQKDLIELANKKPEVASEAVDAWMDSASFERYMLPGQTPIDLLFNDVSELAFLFTLGNKKQPITKGLFIFDVAGADERTEFNRQVQQIATDRKQDVQITEITENFNLKLRFGQKHLQKVEGICVGEPGQLVDNSNKAEFLKLFNPNWFAELTMLYAEVFDYTRGKLKMS